MGGWEEGEGGERVASCHLLWSLPFPDQLQVELRPLSLGAKGTSCLSPLPSPTAQGSQERHRSTGNEELTRG